MRTVLLTISFLLVDQGGRALLVPQQQPIRSSSSSTTTSSTTSTSSSSSSSSSSFSSRRSGRGGLVLPFSTKKQSQDDNDTNAVSPEWNELLGAMISADAATDLEQKYNLQDDPFLGGGVGINGSSGDDIAGRIISGFPFQYLTFSRILIPSVLAGVLGFVAFPALSLWLCTLFNNAGVFAVLSQDSSQFVQNFLTVSSLLFSILVGQTYYFMYTQQEMLYYALFAEVTEAKSLLEQVALVCQGRAMYPQVLKSMQDYVESDLKQLREDPAVLLSARPMDDPLESILYLTSVGLPSNIYETIFDLRQARAKRLGALQRKLPELHMWLLWTLAFIEVVSFPLLGAGTQIIGGYNILTVEGCIFGVMTIGIVMTLRVVNELWRPVGGAYNVDAVLKTMVRGLEDELQQRLDGNFVPKQTTKTKTSTSGRLPGVTIDAEYFQKARLIVQQSNNSTLSPSKKKS